ncbi:MAG TPA: GerMN domain-containing protein [Pyrinomonadaceae bacterium]|nr:GerMN domain-containing protein [Pyrinomonadaceae bacterium]
MKKIFFLFALFTFVPTALAQTSKPVSVKIYLQKGGDLTKKKVRLNLVPLKRKADSGTRLESALKWLFAPVLTTAERKLKFQEIDFGMKFEGVSLKNGTAIVKFSETDTANYRESSAAIFAAAVRKTAKQFREVNQVKICSIGEISFDIDSDKPLFLPCE